MFQTDSKQSPDGWFFQSLHVRLSSRQEMRKAVLVELKIRCKRREDSGALAFLKFKKKTTVADIWDLPRQIAMQQPASRVNLNEIQMKCDIRFRDITEMGLL